MHVWSGLARCYLGVEPSEQGVVRSSLRLRHDPPLPQFHRAALLSCIKALALARCRRRSASCKTDLAPLFDAAFNERLWRRAQSGEFGE